MSPLACYIRLQPQTTSSSIPKPTITQRNGRVCHTNIKLKLEMVGTMGAGQEYDFEHGIQLFGEFEQDTHSNIESTFYQLIVFILFWCGHDIFYKL